MISWATGKHKPWQHYGKNIALHGYTERQGTDIEQEKVGGLGRGSLAREDTSLDGSTVGNGLIGVDALLKLLTVKEIGQKLLDLGNTGRTTNQDDLVNLGLLDASILENLSDRLKGARESLGVQVFETSTGDGHGEVLTIEERVNLDGGLGTAGQGTLGTLASSSKSSQGTGITAHVLLGLAGKLFLAVVEQVGVEILTTQMGVTSGSLDSEDTTLDVEKRHIESTTTKIVDQDVALLLRLARAQTVGNGGSGGLVNDTEDIETRNGTGVLGSLTLVVVEVGGDGDDGLLDLLAKLGLGNLLHLSM